MQNSNMELVNELCKLPEIERAKLEMVYDAVQRHKDEMTSEQAQELAIWTRTITSTNDYRQITKMLMKKLNITTFKKEHYGTSDLILVNETETLKITIWFSLPYPEKKFLPILSKYYNCNVEVRSVKKRSSVRKEIACRRI